METCIKCGGILWNENWKYCPTCGAEIEKEFVSLLDDIKYDKELKYGID